MNNRSKHLGILGLGSSSTLYYINQLNKKFNDKFGGYSTAPFLMLNINFDTINPYLPEGFEILEPIVLNSVKTLERMGCHTILIPNITIHRTLDRLEINALNVLHPIELTANHLKASGIEEVVLLGSIYTMQSKYFEQLGVNIIRPSTTEMQTIDNIRKDVYQGNISKKNQCQFQEVIGRYEQEAPIVLACSELSMIAESCLNKNTVDMVDLQVEAALKFLEE
mgnify:CR=1 FL=1